MNDSDSIFELYKILHKSWFLIALRRRYFKITSIYHPKDWYMCTEAIMYAYNCQPQKYHAVEPFELVFSRITLPSATKAEHSELKAPKYLKKWKLGNQQTLETARKKILEAQARYKLNYENRLPRDKKIIKPEDYVFLTVEWKGDKEPDKSWQRPLKDRSL